MMLATATTRPTSYTKTFQPSRAADASAVRTGLGTESFIGFDIYRLPSGRFVPQHIPEHRPASIVHRFSHPCSSKAFRIHIADDDQTVFIGQFSAGRMQMVAARVRDLGVNSPRSLLVACPQGAAKCCFVLPVMLKGRDAKPVAAPRQRSEPQINANLTVTSRQAFLCFATEGYVPAPTGVLSKGSAPKFALQDAAIPETEFAFEVSGVASLDFHAALKKRHPAKGFLASKTSSVLRAFTNSISGHRKEPANLRNRRGVNAEKGARAGAEHYKIEVRGPSNLTARFSAAFSLALSCRAEIPNLIAGNCVPIEVTSCAGILNSEFESGVIHTESLTVLSGVAK